MVTGTLNYRKQLELPPGANILVQLIVVARGDEPDAVIAEQRFATYGRQAPFGFNLRCLPSQIDQQRTYVVRASITIDGLMRLATTQHYPVLTYGNLSTADLLLT